ncbi:non-ribosomal peptide synthase protein (TIGR01720 family)/amino acid adenylation domain-containing protein [Mumia flava]|uniref:Non-ribosomal peptide synthase protein (TIGR01720 family)/amino acid adenylation domain-containing protein n=1 Tax=Mumia flava TaxID=1348852 RepID=A0A0B2B2G3_9ACTN|nr:non-ribosomal peptide synthetase [Mumia flava]PJJ54107.1 non-ribosomal peptide synthase protein (TIGR01720 family)/amino acid adenylation domain-containing protein [Mumia flava]
MTDLESRITALPAEQRAVLEARLAELAPARGHGPSDRIVPRDRSAPTPLSVAQHREWAVGQIRSVNNITGALRLEGRLDLTLLSDVLTTILERHEVLRTTIEVGADGTPVQVVQPVTPVPTPVTDLTRVPPSRRDEEVTRAARSDAARPFDHADPQRLRVTLLALEQDVHVALFAADHAASDAWSLAIIVEELAAIYRGRTSEGTGELPPLEVQFGDVAAWQRAHRDADREELEVRHWREQLAGMPAEAALPVDRPYPARPTYAGAVYDMHLPAELAAAVHRFGEQEGASLFTVLLAAGSVLLNRYGGEDDVVVGSLVSGRTRAETQRLIGSFANPLPLRLRLRDDLTLREVVGEARETLANALDHQDLPFDRVAEELGLGRESTRSSFSPMWINVIAVPDMTLELPGLRIVPVSIAPAKTSVDLTLNVTPSGDTLLTQWHYMTELLDPSTVALLADQFQRVLRELVTEPDTPVWAVELATGAPSIERASVPATPSAEPASAPDVVGFVERFQRRVAVAPYAPAVICDGVATSYDELNRRANRLAHRLRATGVRSDARVGVLVDRSPSLAVAILAVLKAGGAYVPIDPTYPPERMAFLLADSGARVLVTEALLADAPVRADGWTTVLMDEAPRDEGSGPDDEDDLDPPAPSAAAYVVYTSGSTGRPKGAVIEHRSLAVFAADVVERLGLGTGDRFLQFASPSFDVLAEELFPTWLAGGAVVIPTKHLLSGEDDLASLVERERLTVMELPTAYWHEWVRELDRLGRELPAHLRLVIIGGERVLPERLALWRRTGVPLAHVYGLTETTVSSTFFRLDPVDPVAQWPNLPIGTPLPSADLRILDRRLRPVPAGGVGELYIGGISLARGYLGRPGLTAQRFVADPTRSGARLYRTGDLVRRRADGNLEFHSRVDTQVKIRGFRVEPTEVESVLTEHPGVAEAVVAVHEPAPGDRRLVAYVVPAGAPGVAAELRAFLAERLPGYLVPSAFVEVDALPLNANGKIDRARLPAPDRADAPTGAGFRAPTSATEKALAGIVAGVVGVAQVGVDDNFFEVGGDSILAIQVVAQAQQAGLRLTPYDLFANPSVGELAAVVEAGHTVDAEQTDVTGPAPLAPTQHWFCAAGLAEPAHWNTSVLVDLAVEVDPEVLREAVEAVVGHHDGLRQRLLLAGARTRARIAPRGDETPFAVHDLSVADDPDLRAAETCADLQRGLDPAVGPMVRVALLRLGRGRRDQLAVVAHQLVVDAASMRILLEDLETAVVQLAAGEPLRFLPKTTSWQSWARRLARYASSESVRGQRTYWSEVVTGGAGGQPRGRLPEDRTVEVGVDTEATTRTVSARLDPATTTTLLAAPERLACTVEEVLLAALGRTLEEWTGAERHLVDVTRSERTPLFDDVDVTRTVGWFSPRHPLALSAVGDDALASVKAALRAVPAGGTGWQLLAQTGEAPDAGPIDLAFGYTGSTTRPASGAFAVAAETIGTDRSPAGRRPHPLEVRAGGRDGELVVDWSFSELRHDAATVERLAARHAAEVRTLIGAQDADRATGDFPLARVDRAQLDGLLGRLAEG